MAKWSRALPLIPAGAHHCQVRSIPGVGEKVGSDFGLGVDFPRFHVSSTNHNYLSQVMIES